MASLAMNAQTFENKADNAKCFSCHGQSVYQFYNDWIERDVKKMMNPFYVIDTGAYYMGSHNQFYCIDCHSSDYEEFPHAGELRYEPIYTCIDCHGGDDNFAHFQFELIEDEFLSSVHSSDVIEDFSCWKCHDPHSFKLNVRTGESIRDIVAYANDLCFACHTDLDKFGMLSDNENTSLVASHDWLPNQRLHYQKVRCIECHNQTHDSLLVAHKVLPAGQAVKNCAECHSKNTMLLSTLYKHQMIENRQEKGFVNAVIINESYVIGASRNYWLNLISIIVFGLTLIGIAIHGILRFKFRK
jgi:hypothetical protein